MGKISPREVIDTIIDVLVGSYGNLGYVDFRVLSIKPNHKENVYIVKYTFVPRNGDRKRLFYEARVNIKDKNVFESKEITEKDLKDDSQ